MSQIYADAAEFEAVFTRLFERIEADDPQELDELVEQAMVIRFVVRDPKVELWVDGRSAPAETTFGRQDLDATLSAELKANDLHDLLLGKLQLAKALLFRKLKVQGSKSKAMKLESLLHAMQAVYPSLVDTR